VTVSTTYLIRDLLPNAAGWPYAAAMDKGATGDAVVHALAAASTAVRRTLLVSSHHITTSLQSMLPSTEQQQHREQQAAVMTLAVCIYATCGELARSMQLLVCLPTLSIHGMSDCTYCV
jgi:hypothetical protein